MSETNQSPSEAAMSLATAQNIVNAHNEAQARAQAEARLSALRADGVAKGVNPAGVDWVLGRRVASGAGDPLAPLSYSEMASARHREQNLNQRSDSVGLAYRG